MKEFIETIVKALVDHPDQVTLTEVQGERTTVYELHVGEGDLGKVIGNTARRQIDPHADWRPFRPKRQTRGPRDSGVGGQATDYIVVGRFGRPRGVSGEISITRNRRSGPLHGTDRVVHRRSRERASLRLEAVTMVGNRPIVKIEGIDSREEAAG